MDPRHNQRMMRRKRKRAAFLTVIITATVGGSGGDVLAQSRANPFFHASARRHVVDGGSVQKVGRDQVEASRQGAGIPDRDAVGAIGVIDFDRVNRLLSQSAEPDESKTPPHSVRVPRRLPRVNQSSETPAAAPHSADQVMMNQHIIHHSHRHDAPPSRWLPSMTSESCQSRAAKHLDDAYREYSVHAWASAEASAWKALELAATAIDIERQTNSATQELSAVGELRKARTAIKEARDFLSAGASVDRDTLIGIVSSHRTPVISKVPNPLVSPTEAVDRYLDFARVTLMPIAAIHVEAAQAMDLIAAIHLGRNEATMLPQETSLCLRRAALQGQPTNASLASRLGLQLADMGLDSEAEVTLRHAVSIQPSPQAQQALARVLQRQGKTHEASRIAAAESTPSIMNQRKRPEVVQLSPSQFASISPAFNVVSAGSRSQPGGGVASGNTAGGDTASGKTAKTKPSGISRFVPATLAGFRMPFSSRSESEVNDSRGPQSVQEEIESTISPVYHADEFRTHSTTETKESTLKQIIGKFPRLW